MFIWVVGTCFGALWASSSERGRSSARLYSYCMAYCYLAALVLAALPSLGVGLGWLALEFFVFLVFLIGVLVVGRRRLRRQKE